MKNHNVKNQRGKIANLGLDGAQKESLLGLSDNIGVKHTPCGFMETSEIHLDESRKNKKEPHQKKPQENGESTRNSEGKSKNLKENGDEIHLRAKKMKLSAIESTYTTAICSPPGRVYGHTGYLTF